MRKLCLGLLVVAVLGCPAPGDTSRGPLPCLKRDCGYDRARFSGSLPLAVTEPVSILVTLCRDDECFDTTAEVDAEGEYTDGLIVSAHQCPAGWEDVCVHDGRWFLGVRISFDPDSDPVPGRFRVRATDLMSGETLIDEEWSVEAADFTAVNPAPDNCDDNADNIRCLHFDARWELP